MNFECIAVIVNDPEKTEDLQKLVAVLGKRRAAYLGRSMIFDTLAVCLSMPDVDVAIFYRPGDMLQRFDKFLHIFSREEKDGFIRSRIDEVAVYPQNSSAMIETISRAFAEIFAKDYKRVIMIGAYCMPLNTTLLKAAFFLLEKNNVVIGPAFGGRYYLFGMSKCMPEAFEGVHWESDDFYVRLGQNLQATQAKVQELELSYEVYSTEELNQLIGDIERWRSVDDRRTAYHTERFLRSMC